MKHYLFRHNIAVVLITAVFVGVGIFCWVVKGGSLGWKMMAVFSSGGLSFFYFFQKQKLAETHLMKELITDFNCRYDGLNEQLNAIREQGNKNPAPALTSDECTTLYDCFNLCAEEYLFKELGYVEPLVWQAWYQGMKIYSDDPRILELWDREERTGSYYGFTFPRVYEARRST